MMHESFVLAMLNAIGSRGTRNVSRDSCPETEPTILKPTKT
jgi:hypothetical protein